MKKNLWEFFRRGMSACGFGPLILAVLYLALQNKYGLQTLTVNEVCLGIFSISALAFIAGGMNFIYQVEQLPLMAAILIHGCILYASYLATYLLNGWLKWGAAPIFVFSCIFVVGYFAIWLIIYLVIRSKTRKLNEVLQAKQRLAESGQDPCRS